MKAKTIIRYSLLLLIIAATGCQVRYSFTGGQFSGAKTFSVAFFKPQTALASQAYSQKFTEALKQLVLTQSPMSLNEENGDLRYEGNIIDYRVAPVAIQGNETASLSRLTITIKVKYINTLEPDLSFERSFSKFADFPADQDFFSQEESLWENINTQLTQDVYNASVGNW
ncbi:MAG: LptE family protein [Crocinitomicaceae bacterium]|nr:LptE family protein [Crocinitomicaceae bacterium]